MHIQCVFYCLHCCWMNAGPPVTAPLLSVVTTIMVPFLSAFALSAHHLARILKLAEVLSSAHFLAHDSGNMLLLATTVTCNSDCHSCLCCHCSKLHPEHVKCSKSATILHSSVCTRKLNDASRIFSGIMHVHCWSIQSLSYST